MPKLSRNEPCWCGSGKKYKQCHMRQDLAEMRTRRQLTNRQRREVNIKTDAEIDGIRRASHVTRDILDALEDKVRPGISTEQIDQWVNEMTATAGARPAPLNYRGYPNSVCTSINEVVCHGIPTAERILQDGDILNIDVTSILDGFYGDASRMFLIGDVSDEARELVHVTRECMYLGIEQVRPGSTVGDVGHAIQSHAESHGYSVVRAFVGHGTGVRFHEPPDVYHYGEPGVGLVLQRNMVFTIEPMINIGGYEVTVLEDDWTAITTDRTLSAQWEHTLRVTGDGYEILTA